MTTDITELTQESARESGSILIIVAARMARREFFTPLHALCESGKRVVSTRALCDAVERAEEHMVSQVSKIVDGHDRLTKKLKEAESRNAELVEALEKAQPVPVVPVVPEEAYSDDFPELYPSQPDAWAAGWNACRAAMLQGLPKSAGESNNCRSRENVQDLLAGNCRENGNSSTKHFREISETSTNRSREHFISLCNEFWNWSEMDLVCSDDRGYELRMEWDGKVFKHPVTQALWRMYQAAPTGIPVIPDGYVMVPKEPTEDMRDAYYESSVAPISRLSICGYQAMLAAAPQEVK
jgi:hypothetical protein|nr:MAG TPA: hypothetical protein [Caudoviricetes sp.]